MILPRIPVNLVANSLLALFQKPKTRIKFEASWQSGNKIFLFFVYIQQVALCCNTFSYFLRIFQKYLWSKEKQNTDKNTKEINCYRMLSTGNYVNLFLHALKTNMLKFMMVMTYISWDCPPLMYKNCTEKTELE